MKKLNATLAAGALLATGLLAACGAAGDDGPAAEAARTCYRCYFANGGLVQQTYSCSVADAQQFGRPCLR